ncbi:Putative phosphatidate phosphatase [Eumeta japonica]|uniref:Phosphatidate phosphatase n=1 Tax=Eumeta variegata TaxID=151549 RepID=A0A4C1VDS2_EUMVA|nr:Putative phosphatidate phosphatase [Eumeta japonica]
MHRCISSISTLLCRSEWGVLVELLPPKRMGFHCNDPALSHTFSGDTISWKWLLGISAFLPLIMMLIAEKKFHPENVSGKSINNIRALNWYKEYLFGLLLNLVLVQMLKMLVGAPRPHFFDSCRPEEALTCKDSEYVNIYKCTQANWMHEANKSFPSGHSSLAVYAGLFLIWYIHTRKPDLSGYKSTLVWKLQVLCLILTVLCCISRIYDHRHHWWDVLTGASIGVAVLVYTESAPSYTMVKNGLAYFNKDERAVKMILAQGVL